MISSDDLKDIYRKNKVMWKDTNRIIDKYEVELAEKIIIKDKLDIDIHIDNKVVKVFNEYLFDTIQAVVDAKFIPLVLINASNCPLDNVKNGLPNIENDLYRCSNISKSINESLYPIKDLEMIYCPNITIFKNKDNKILKNKYQISVVLSVPIDRPILIYIKDQSMVENYNNPLDELNMKTKITNIFELAVLKKYDCLILPDFGCQNSNPTNKIIDFFNDAIDKYPIKYVFFSIKKTHKNDTIFESFHTLIQR